MLQMIGQISLNISMVFYLISYFPQLIYNQKQNQISGLSFYFHFILFLNYAVDLIYAFGLQLPWQYCLVDIVGIFCLLIQHLQIKKVVSKKTFYWSAAFFLGLAILGAWLLSFEKSYKDVFIAMGYVSQLTALIYCLPQIAKNITVGTALSLGAIYLVIDLVCGVCDSISAWILSWPLPSKLGAIFSILLCLVLIIQRIATQKRNEKIRVKAVYEC